MPIKSPITAKPIIADLGLAIRPAMSITAFLTLALTACLHKRDPHSLNSLWFYTYRSDSVVTRSDSLATTAKDALELTPANFLELRPDNSFTRDFGRFEYGTWVLKENRLLLTNQMKETMEYTLHFAAGGDLQLSVGDGVQAHPRGDSP